MISSASLLVIPHAGSKLVLCFLLLPQRQPCFAGAVSLRERIKGFQSGPLLLPLCLASRGMRLLQADGVTLLLERRVQTVEEFLVIAPLRLPESILGRQPKTRRVFIPILQQQGEFLLFVTFNTNQAGEALRRFVVAIAHQLEHGLQGEGSGQDGLAYLVSAGDSVSAQRGSSADGAKQGLHMSDAIVESRSLAEALLQQLFELRIHGDRLVELRV
jgi:hypothetical protein